MEILKEIIIVDTGKEIGTAIVPRMAETEIGVWSEVFGGRVMTIDASRRFSGLVSSGGWKDEFGWWKSRSCLVGSLDSFDVMDIYRNRTLGDDLGWGVVSTKDNGRANFVYGDGFSISRRHMYACLCDCLEGHFKGDGGGEEVLDIKNQISNVEMIINRSERGLPWVLMWGGRDLIGMDRLIAGKYEIRRSRDGE